MNTPPATPGPLRDLGREFIRRGNEFERVGKKRQREASEPGEGDLEIQAAAIYFECARMLQEALRKGVTP